MPCLHSHLCAGASVVDLGLADCLSLWCGRRPQLTRALFPPAPAAGGTGCGTCQAGHHDGAERHHRGTWTPQSASHRVYSPFIPLIYHNQRSTLTLAGLKEWRPQGSSFLNISWACIHLGLSSALGPQLPPTPKLKGCQTCLRSTSKLISAILPAAFGATTT